MIVHYFFAVLKKLFKDIHCHTLSEIGLKCKFSIYETYLLIIKRMKTILIIFIDLETVFQNTTPLYRDIASCDSV